MKDMEFKGTKTDWEIIKDKPALIKVGNIIYRPEMTLDDFDSWEDYHDVTEIESIYNALIISKSPEMLEMLIDIVEQENVSQSAHDAIYELIKQATEL